MFAPMFILCFDSLRKEMDESSVSFERKHAYEEKAASLIAKFSSLNATAKIMQPEKNCPCRFSAIS